MQETALPQRLAKSAKDLAYATLTGANFELKDPRESKLAGSSTQASLRGNEQSSESVSSRSTPSHQQSGFRNRPSSIVRRQTEENFDRFHRTDDFQTWQHLKSAAFIEPMREGDVQHQGSDMSKNILLVASATEIVEGVEDHMTNVLDLSKSEAKSVTVTEQSSKFKKDSSHRAALRRLDQIGAHLQRNTAMQKLEQDAYIQFRVSMHNIASQAQVEHACQVVNELRDPARLDRDQKDRYIDDQQVSSVDHDPVTHDKRPLPAVLSENEEDDSQRQFHCPYYACHENMRVFSTSTSSSSQKSCVHVGCKFQTETSTSWIEHVHTPHHDLQGSA